MLHLSQFLPLSALQPFKECSAPPNNCDMLVDNDAWDVKMTQIAQPAFKQFFRALREAGRINPVRDSQGYHVPLWEHWNTLARAEPSSAAFEEALGYMCHIFAHKLVFRVLYRYLDTLAEQGQAAADEVDLEAEYAEHFDEFSKGTYAWHTYGTESCQITGWRMCTQFVEWSDVLGLQMAKTGPKRLITPGPAPTIAECTMNFPSGRLLVADCFRVEGLGEFSESPECDRQAREGRQEITNWYAREHGFVHVPLGNVPALIFQRGNMLIVGDNTSEDGYGKDMGKYQYKGYVTTDLWAASVIAYERLVELVSRTHPNDAKERVDKMIAEQHGVTEIQVTPGTYHVYHHGNYNGFYRLAKNAGFNLGEPLLKPYFIIAPIRIEQLDKQPQG